MAFVNELASLLNRHCQENSSDTPDFILAEYMLACLRAWNQGVQKRDKWHGRDPNPLSKPEAPEMDVS